MERKWGKPAGGGRNEKSALGYVHAAGWVQGTNVHVCAMCAMCVVSYPACRGQGQT